jgi:hypothetical protein
MRYEAEGGDPANGNLDPLLDIIFCHRLTKFNLKLCSGITTRSTLFRTY